MAGGFTKRGGRGGGSRGGGKFAKKRSNDDDDAPRASKRAKADEDDDDDDAGTFVPTLQKDGNGDHYIPLKANDTRRVTISDFKNNTLVSIREYYDLDGEKRPGKKGISLSIDQYNALLAAAPLIESVLLKKEEKVVRPDYNGGAAAATPGPALSAEKEKEPETVSKVEDEEDEDDAVSKADDE